MTTEVTDAELRARVEKLERQVRALARGLLWATAGPLVGFAVWATLSLFHVDTRLLTVGDRLSLDGHSMSAKGAGGDVAVGAFGDSGLPGVVVVDAAQRTRVTLGLGADGKPALSFLDEKGNVTWRQE